MLTPQQKAAFAILKTRSKPEFSIEKFCFKEQIAFIRDQSQFKTAVCSRRSGKTVACAADLLNTAITHDNVVCLYTTLKRVNAKRIIWPELLKINRDYRLGGEANESDLALRMPNGSIIYASGAKDKSEIENFRGLALKKVYIDECFHPDTLIETDNGAVKISDIKIGTVVKNAIGYGTVEAISRKMIDRSMILGYGGKYIECSLNHPFFTKRGWVKASDLTPGDLLGTHNLSMRLLRDNCSEKKLWERLCTQVLREELQWKGGPKSSSQYSEDEVKQSNERSKDQKKDGAISEKAWVGSSYSWGKWISSYRTRKVDNEAYSRGKMESCNWARDAWQRLSIKLQGRLSLCTNKISHRDRREFSLFKKIARYQKREKAEFIRLDSVEIQEPASFGRNRAGYFYDLSVSGHPSFVVEGVLVHNCQSFRPHIEELIDDVISKALFDYSGQLCLIGTPGMIPSGYFYKCATSSNWTHYSWTMFDNPYLEMKSGKSVQQLVKEDCDRMGVDISHPKIQRECYGRWVTDMDSLVYKYNAAINHFDGEPYLLNGKPHPDWEFVLGIDVGYEDADAIAVLGWHKHEQIAYLVKEEINTKQGITELAGQIEALIKEYNPNRIVIDAGALGKKIAEEMRRRFSLPLVAAEKARKFEKIEFLNDAMRTRKFFAKKDSRFAQDCLLVEWDYDKSTPDRLVVSGSFHSDINEAVTYAWTESQHWLTEKAPIVYKPNTPAWMQHQEEEMEKVALKQLESKEEDLWGDVQW